MALSASTSTGSQAGPAAKAAWILLALAWVCFLLPFPGTGVFLGWPLNLVAFILAIVAMAKGGTRKGLMQLVLSLIVSPVVYFIGTAMLVGAVAAAGQAGTPATAKAKATPAKADEAAMAAPQERIAVSAMHLYADYSSNEITADSRYKDKALLISGTVRAIESDLHDEPHIQLAAGDFATVSISGLSVEEASELSKGSRIQVACIGDGEVLSFPTTRDCKLQK